MGLKCSALCRSYPPQATGLINVRAPSNPTEYHLFCPRSRICYGPQETLYWTKYWCVLFWFFYITATEKPCSELQYLTLSSKEFASLRATSYMDFKLHKGTDLAFYFSNMTYLIELFRILWAFTAVGQTNLDFFFPIGNCWITES